MNKCFRIITEKIRFSIYAQAFLGGFSVVFPDTADLSKSVFFASFASLLAVNVAAWGSKFSGSPSFHTSFFYNLVIIGLNTIVSVPITISTFSAWKQNSFHRLQYILYPLSAIIVLVSLGVFMPEACCGTDRDLLQNTPSLGCLNVWINIGQLLAVALLQISSAAILECYLLFHQSPHPRRLQPRAENRRALPLRCPPLYGAICDCFKLGTVPLHINSMGSYSRLSQSQASKQ